MGPWNRILLAIAGLFGAAGVALAAWASHRAGGETLMTAALFLLIHAAPLTAIGLASPGRTPLIGGSILAAGALLFSGDLALRTIIGAKPLAMAAPTGGTLMIFGWLFLGAAAIGGGRRKPSAGG